MSLSHRILLPVMAATAIGFASFSHAADSKVIASVNGKAITQQDYDNYVSKFPKGNQAKLDHKQVVDELVTRELVYQDAIKQGIDKDPEVLEKLEALKQNLIMSAALNKAVNKSPVSDSELKKMYDDKVASFDATEYKASHILLKSKEDADKVITELDMGGDFAELAKKKSTGPTGKKGGELGWFSPQQMVPAFSAAVAKLEKGKYTKQPVQTKFGWHVIKLEDTRKAEPPSFDSIKPRLEKIVQQQRAQEYLQALKEKAKIKTN